MKVLSIWLGEVDSSEVESLLTAKAKELGYAFLQERASELRSTIEQAGESADSICDAADERELEEVEFMMSTFQDEEGYPDPDKLDF
jgi:hypothetical protein